MNEEEIEKIKDLKAVYSGAVQAGELSIANIIKKGIDLIGKLQKENEKLERANKCYINSIHSIVPVLNQDYIEKQKIKDKIEELNKKEQELQNSISDEEREEYSDASISFDLMDIHIRREELQDLIEEKGK